MVQAIIFDCFGVLTTDLWKEFVATLSSEEIEPARSLNYQYDAGQLDRIEFLRAVQALTGRRPEEIETKLDNETNKNIELLSYISDLKPMYKIGLLSNIASNWINDTFLTATEQKLFDVMIFSHEVRLAKPDPEIFELTAERLGVTPEACVLIDDSERHCVAAAGLGMKAILYEDFGQMRGELENVLA